MKKVITCIVCEKEITTEGAKKFCSNKCHATYTHRTAYKRFLERNEEYCIGNYTPKGFKDFFLEEQDGVCSICKCLPTWNNKDLTFVLDHIDGDASNNKRINLRLICPNCDSQLDTFKSKNKNSTRRNYWKDKIIRDNKLEVPTGDG